MHRLSADTVFDARYELQYRLGTGSSGEVWLARDRQIPRDVALKIMNVSLLTSETHMQRFQREVDSLNSLGNEHPNIPQLYGANAKAERPYLVMEYINGRSLKDLITAHQIHEIAFKKRLHNIIQQIGDALTYAHENGIVHRDLKPENVKIIGDAERTYLLDFSIAVLDLDETHSGLGTPRYTAPEVTASAAADIFALGMMYYEIIFGVHPFFEPSEHIRNPIHAGKLITEKLKLDAWKLPSQQTYQIATSQVADWSKVDLVFKQAFAIEPRNRPTNAYSLVKGLLDAFRDDTTAEIVVSSLSGEREVLNVQDELGAEIEASASTVIDTVESPIEDQKATFADNLIPIILIAVIMFLTGLAIGISMP